MANIQLPTGKTINISIYEFLFRIKDHEVDLFFQSCIADDLGNFIEDPFANNAVRGYLEIHEDSEKETIEEAPITEDELDEE